MDQRMVKDQEGVEEHLEEASQRLDYGQNYKRDGEGEMADINFLLAFAHIEAARNCAEDEEHLLQELEEQDMKVEEETSEVEETLRSKLGKSEHEDFRSAAMEMLSDDSGRKVEKVSEDDMLTILDRHGS
jgi:hypothetical protein